MNKKSESGQAIVLLVFAVIGLIGFTALAIDGGSIFADRRQAQSASDASSLAGGGNIALWLDNNHINRQNFDCPDNWNNTIEQKIQDIMDYGIYKAEERAEDNDYVDEEIGVSAECEDNGPLFDKKYIDVTTNITKTTRTSFAQLLYNGPVTNQVKSVVRVRPQAPIAYGQAIVALNEDPCSGNKNGIIMGGSNDIFIRGGGIWSNGCMVCEGLKDYQVKVILGIIGYVGWLYGCDLNDTLPPPVKMPEALPYSSYSVPEPDCSAPGAITVESISEKNAVLQTGQLYCITDSKSAIKVTSGDLTGENVTLYVVNGGDIEINTNGIVTLTAPPVDSDPKSAIPGLLIYSNPLYKNVITINGNVDSKYGGLIYAPNADVTINGTSNLGTPVHFSTQIIGYNVKITGTAIIDIVFNQDLNYPKPPYLDLID